MKEFLTKYKFYLAGILVVIAGLTTYKVVNQPTTVNPQATEIVAMDNSPVLLEDTERFINSTVEYDDCDVFGPQTRRAPKGTKVTIGKDGKAVLVEDTTKCRGNKDHVFKYTDLKDGVHHLTECENCNLTRVASHTWENGVCKYCEAKKSERVVEVVEEIPEEITCNISCHGIMDVATDDLQEAIPNEGYLLTSCSVEIEEGDTVYDVLMRVVNSKGVSCTSGPSAYGMYVSMIDGLSDSKVGHTAGWCYYVNGSMPTVSCSDCVLNPGDTISWEYDDDWDLVF